MFYPRVLLRALVSVFTADNPSEVLDEVCVRMKSSKHHPNAIGIQFVQIGNADGANDALRDLALRNANASIVHMRSFRFVLTWSMMQSMVDTVQYDGELTAEKLTRILLGALHPNIRALLAPLVERG
jgi:hypothetical protein